MDAKITIDATSALTQTAGIGRFTRGLLQALGETDHDTAYTIAYTKDATGQSRPALPANFHWRQYGLTQKQAVWLWHRLRLPMPAEMWTGRTDLFHSPDYTLPPLARARGIVTIHDLSFETMPETHEPKLRRYLQQAVPPSIRRATHVFADSQSTKEEMLRFYGTDPAKVTVVYPGVEARFRPFSANSGEDAATLEHVQAMYKLKLPFLLSLGTLEPRKNTATLIRAFAAYRAANETDVSLVIAGGGGWLEQREALEALVQELGLSEHVRFTGFVADEHLPALLNLARALAYPSLYEGFGLPVLEALACGVPVVTARNTSLPEAGGTAARYIDDPTDVQALAHELAIVLHYESERTRMVKEGLAHAARFTWKATGQQVVHLYQQILG
jgi:glycosyltransferase involved in cell wall biosynthesis